MPSHTDANGPALPGAEDTSFTQAQQIAGIQQARESSLQALLETLSTDEIRRLLASKGQQVHSGTTTATGAHSLAASAYSCHVRTCLIILPFCMWMQKVTKRSPSCSTP